jgi:ubiquinone/menaquinone biosynthesis C-methylase UbiE
MNIIPWRVRSAISDRFPLIYHLTSNLFRKREGAEYWDKNLAEWWGHDVRRWPTKSRIISERCKPDSTLIDIACGNGSILRDLRALGFQNLSGLEISHYAVNRLREEGFSMFHGVLPRIPLPDQTFDVVIASQVLEHIIRRSTFASEISRIMKPGGQAFIFVPNDCLGPIDEPEHVIKYNRKTFESFLKRHFDDVSVEVIKDTNFAMTVLLGHVKKPTLENRKQ